MKKSINEEVTFEAIVPVYKTHTYDMDEFRSDETSDYAGDAAVDIDFVVHVDAGEDSMRIVFSQDTLEILEEADRHTRSIILDTVLSKADEVVIEHLYANKDIEYNGISYSSNFEGFEDTL